MVILWPCSSFVVHKRRNAFPDELRVVSVVRRRSGARFCVAGFSPVVRAAGYRSHLRPQQGGHVWRHRPAVRCGR